MSTTNKLKNQRGVALIMVLSILALLMVTIVGFVFSAKTESLAAKNQENDRSARAYAIDTTSWYQSLIETRFASSGVYNKEQVPCQRRALNLAMPTAEFSRDFPLRYDFMLLGTSGGLSANGELDSAGLMEVELDKDPSPLMYNLGFQATVDAAKMKTNHEFTAEAGSRQFPEAKYMAWTPIYSRENQVVNPDEDPDLVARFTFLLVQEGLKFDINGLAKMRGKSSGAVINPPLAYSELFSDIWFDQLSGSGITDPDAVKKMVDERPEMNTGSGDAIAAPWSSWKHIWRSNLFCRDHSRATVQEEDDARKAYNMFTPHSMPNGEWYRYLGVNNNVTDVAYIHRYYIGNILDVDDNQLKAREVSLFTTDQTKISELVPFFANSSSIKPESAMFMQAYNRGVGTPADQDKDSEVWVNKTTKAIPHLGFIKGQCDNIGRGADGNFSAFKNDGTQDLDGYGSKVSDVQRQVSANLVDYNDTNSEPTTDYTGNATAYVNNENRITFCGLEKTPYIAQVRPIINFTNGSAAGTVRIASIQAGVILVDMYGEESGYSFQVTIPEVKIGGTSFPNSGSSPSSGAVSFVGSYSEVEIVNCTLNQVGNDIPEATATDIVIPVMVVEVLKGSSVVDVSLIRNIGMGYPINTVSVNKTAPGVQPNSDGTDGVAMVVAFRDPRCNNYVDYRKENTVVATGFDATYDNKWCQLYVESTGVPTNWVPYTESIYAYSGFLKNNNDGYIKPSDYTAEIDQESDPIRPSTAKIRDEQMTSLWELGCIHRGEPWRTINLKGCAQRHSNGSAEFPFIWNKAWHRGQTKTSGLYKDGDSVLLDQIKMTTEAFTYPQVSVANCDPNYWTMVTRLFKSPAVVENQFMGTNARKYYHWPSEMDNSLLKNYFTRGGSSSSPAQQYYHGNTLNGKNGVPFLFTNCGNTGGQDSWGFRANSLVVGGPDFRGFEPYDSDSKSKNDFYQEEPIGKVSDLIKLRSNIFRSIASVQLLAKIPKMQGRLIEKIYKNDENDPRVINYVNIYSKPGENGIPGVRGWITPQGYYNAWYRIEGRQKMMFMLQRNPEAQIIEIKSKEVLESDY